MILKLSKFIILNTILRVTKVEELETKLTLIVGEFERAKNDFQNQI